VPVTAGTLPTHTPVFIAMLIAVVVMWVADVCPALALGPIVEHLQLTAAARPENEPCDSRGRRACQTAGL